MFPPPVLTEAACGWSLDLRSHIMFSPDAFESDPGSRDFWHATYQHEIAHWVRYQTSSIGLLLTVLQRARAITAQRAINELPDSTRAAVVNRLRAGQPLWTFDSGYDPSLAGPEFAVMGQAWLDLYYAYQLLFDISAVAPLRWHPDEALGSALSDGWRAACSFSGMNQHPGNYVADRLYRGKVKPVTIDGYHLTTRSLWESASTLDELRSDSRDGETLRQLEKLVTYKLEEPGYGGPWAVANRMCPGGTTVIMFLVAVHIATNPPLPYWDQSVRSLTWSDLYPPLRFVKVYDYLRSNLYLHEALEGNREGVPEILDTILRESGITYAIPIGGGHGQLTLDVHPSVSQPIVGDLNTVIRSGLFLRSHWADSPSRFIMPSTSKAYGLVVNDRDEIETLRRVEGASHPPLLQFSDGLHTGGLLTNSQQGTYCSGAWGHNTLDALILGKSVVEQSYLPKGMRVDDPFERFQRNYLAGRTLAW